MSGILSSLEVERKYTENLDYVHQAIQALDSKNLFLVPDYFDDAVKSCPNHRCLWSVETNECLTYYEVQQRANCVAHWAREKVDLPSGSVVGLMMTNCNDFIWICLGLSKAGYIISLFNTSSGHDALRHAFKVSEVKYFIVERSLFSQLDAVDQEWLEETSFVIWDSVNPAHTENTDSGMPQSKRLPIVSASTIISCKDSQPLEISHEWREGVEPESAYCHIFTSGTTGKTKAGIFTHQRYSGAGVVWSRFMGLNDQDILYITIPLFHTAGGVIGVSSAWRARCCLLIRSKFSASEFWKDVRRFSVTAMIYIGELWQYICRGGRQQQMTEDQDERNHSLRVLCGNGLRPKLWREVQSRYGIHSIVECYGQTETPATHPMVNCYGKVGACGYLPPHLWGSPGVERLLQFDPILNQPVRVKKMISTESGDVIEFMSCIDALTMDDGSQIGEVVIKLEGVNFNIYTTDSDTYKMLYRDVFEPGDLWYHSNDLIRREADGFYYFVDRLGDTFRWKGHNVSTVEMADVLSQSAHVVEANVYGVEVPGGMYSGKVGMAAVLLKTKENVMLIITELRSLLHHSLPEYARPKFIRIVSQEGNSKTETFKFKKSEFVLDGFDPSKVSPSDLLLMETSHGYVPLTQEMFETISQGDLIL